LELECRHARALAADALVALLDSGSDGLVAERLRASSPRWHLVLVAFWGMVVDVCRRRGDEGREARLLWYALGPEMRDRIAEVVEKHARAVGRQRATMARFDDLARHLCVDWAAKEEFVRRVAKEVHRLDVMELPEDIEQFCDVSCHDWLGPAFEMFGDEMIVKGTFAKPVFFPVAGPANKYMALSDGRPEFDVLRKAFFVTGDREMQARIVQILCDCESGPDDGVVVAFREFLLHGMEDLNMEPTVFDGFDVAAVAAFVRACGDSRYWFSLDELLFLADVVGEVVVVLELHGHEARFAGSSVMRAGKPVAVVGIESNRTARVRSHFSRMVLVPDPAAAGDLVGDADDVAAGEKAAAGAASAAGGAAFSATATEVSRRLDESFDVEAEPTLLSSQERCRPATGTFNDALEKEALEMLHAWEVSRFAEHGKLYVIPRSQKDEQLARIRAELFSSPRAYASASGPAGGVRLGFGPAASTSTRLSSEPFGARSSASALQNVAAPAGPSAAAAVAEASLAGPLATAAQAGRGLDESFGRGAEEEDAAAEGMCRGGLDSGCDAEPAAGPVDAASGSVSSASSNVAAFRWEGLLARVVVSVVVSVVRACSQVRLTFNRRVWMLCGKLFSRDRLLEQARLLCVVGVAFHALRLVCRFLFGWCCAGLVVSICGDCGWRWFPEIFLVCACLCVARIARWSIESSEAFVVGRAVRRPASWARARHL